MKRFLFLLIHLGFFVSTSGGTIYLHKCMGKVIEVNFYHSDEDKCDQCGMATSSDDNGQKCCSVQTKTFKTQTDLSFFSVAKIWQGDVDFLPAHFYHTVFTAYKFISPAYSIYTDFVPPGARSFQVLYGVFLI